MGWNVEVMFRPREVDEMTTDSDASLAKYLSGVLHDPDLIEITIKPRR